MLTQKFDHTKHGDAERFVAIARAVKCAVLMLVLCGIAVVGATQRVDGPAIAARAS